MTKTIIAPIVALIVLVVQALFGIEIPEDVVNEFVVVIGNLVAVATVIYGIVTNHIKKSKVE